MSDTPLRPAIIFYCVWFIAVLLGTPSFARFSVEAGAILLLLIVPSLLFIRMRLGQTLRGAWWLLALSASMPALAYVVYFSSAG